MSQFEDQRREAEQISRQLAATLVAMGIDWNDERALRVLAREALALGEKGTVGLPSTTPVDLARIKFFGLVGLMLRTMEEGAQEGELIHGSDVWKAVAKALWAEKSPD
ncbi:MAG: hypothetical protein CGU28_08670 [Candidatus Dactylopiibacterium carminicum]|uniref:Uncharacterized protein n=1 Tax=Candidatus Dactylopiibacterium carminicum TaxID=857335 RepID=A0A272ES31_9RHOO|nr:hypothetical protein [Candidatus Dactylopiibacterium carminicum]KAF7598931.1 hypothetical protein BGI27_10695 [Candidatus Dactylopiibacterium carminicum]PAS92907.1 MAG: hypothetical protein CGU29_09780 [Candidatus Dactylopiibacterium carminicum]PAS96486.1 MAG: hypothetical protein CGU28_08670 [Candidatus Dactylopiibacterium carminicum]PAS98947.1 MAG: hypothetical protein BSR46_10715 [Candidatus Dactylopiibacterium carminicum]